MSGLWDLVGDAFGKLFKIPQTKEKDLVVEDGRTKGLLELYKEALAEKVSFGYPDVWNRFFQYYLGKQWEVGNKDKREDWQAQNIVNIAFKEIDNIIAYIIDNKPEPFIIGNNEASYDIATYLNRNLIGIWENNSYTKKILPLVSQSGLIFGTATNKIGFVKKEGVKIVNKDIFNIFPSPKSTDFNDCQYCIDLINQDWKILARDFPEKIEQIFKYGFCIDREVTPQRNITSQRSEFETFITSYPDGTGSRTFTVDLMQPNTFMMGKSRIVSRGEFYVKDFHNKWKLYILAGGTVIDEKDWVYDFLPYSKFCYIPVTGNFWGNGGVQQIELLQKSLNKRHSQMSDMLATLQRIIIFDKNKISTNDLRPDAPGIMLPVDLESGESIANTLSVHNPQQIPPELITLQQIDSRNIQEILGSYNIATSDKMGKNPEAASALAERQELATARMRMRSGFLQDLIIDLSIKATLISLYNINQPEIENLVDKDLRDNISDGIKDKSKERTFVINGRQHTIKTALELPDDFNITIGCSPASPFSKSALFYQLLMLSKVRPDIITKDIFVDTLRKIDYPHSVQMTGMSNHKGKVKLEDLI